MKILKWGIGLLVLGLIGLVFWQWYCCMKKGKESGVGYQCSLFGSEPNFLFPKEVRYTLDDNKCYEVTDYGKDMSFRRVEMEKCGGSSVVKTDVIEEAIYD